MNIHEIFTSLSGEPDGFSNRGGLATFVRLQGCNLKCTWCDTEKARTYDNWKEMSVEEVAKQCTSKHIIITGGEPLLQLEEVGQLVEKLCGYKSKRHLVTIETNGSLPITIDPARTKYETLRFVVDYKLNSSGMNEFMQPEIFDDLYSLDVIKFVIVDLMDYRLAKELVIKNHHWTAKKVFSPVLHGKWAPRLAVEMVKDKLEGVTLSMQLHKLLGLR